jgi:hypothetical protein
VVGCVATGAGDGALVEGAGDGSALDGDGDGDGDDAGSGLADDAGAGEALDAVVSVGGPDCAWTDALVTETASAAHVATARRVRSREVRAAEPTEGVYP